VGNCVECSWQRGSHAPHADDAEHRINTEGCSMVPIITIQTRDPDLIADLRSATPPSGVEFRQEQQACIRGGKGVEFVLYHDSSVEPAVVATWLWSRLQGHDSILVIEHRRSSSAGTAGTHGTWAG